MRPILALTLLVSLLAAVSNAAPVISEFCASNQNGLQDADGDRPDWVEIYNPDPVPADLTDWYLTDNAAAKTKWRFPAVSIPARGYLVVFASEKNRRVPGQPLHTNFALGAGGEYLGLILPDGQTAASEFHPSFPEQFPNLSYGTPSNEVPVILQAEGSSGQWIVPTSGNPASTWINTNFNAASWNTATLGIGYDTNTGSGQVNFLPQIGSGGNTQAMRNVNTSCYLRVPFTVAEGTQLLSLKLRLKYDDGFIAWLNGQPLMSGGTQLRRLCPNTVAWNSAATGSLGDSPALSFEDFDITESASLLVTGQNVLCIQGLNQRLDSSDFLLRPEISGTMAASGLTLDPGYFSTPTPGAKNSGPSTMVIPQEVTFSRNSGTFTGSFSLTLGGAVGGQQIIYTTDGSVPVAPSIQKPAYSGPITLSSNAVVRARIYSPATGTFGFMGARHYELLNANLFSYNGTGQPFKSALPIVVLNNNGGGEIGDTQEPVRMQIFDRDASGYATLSPSSVPESYYGGINIRGRSSAGFAKKSYGIELQDENGQGVDAEVLGMPAGEDWALVGCYEYDRAFSRNAWIYEMSRQAGRWSPRTRLVEVFFNQDGNELSYTNADYRGVYILCETIRRGEDRVDVANMEKGETTQPGVSGGYIFKVDQPESDEYSWKTTRGLPLNGTGGDNLVIHRPKLADLATQQSTYLRSYFQSFEDALYTESAASFPSRTYRNYIDSASWADHNIFNMLAKNVDALRLSAYFYKDRNGKMFAGPLWDFDRSVNSTDGRDNDPTNWNGTGDGTNYLTFAWWEKLFTDVEFKQTYVDRWQKLRKGALSTANVNSVLDGYLAEFKSGDTNNPAARDYARWYGAGSNNIITELGNMKSWLSSRSVWVDSQFCAPPTIVRPAGPVMAGLDTTIVVPSGTTVYYTTDGSDPRAEGGNPSPTAQPYSGSIPITATMTITARAWRSGAYAAPSTNWSGPVQSLYLVNETYATAATLQVSAVNYHPLPPDAAEAADLPEAEESDFEWIELKNVSTAAINLDGVSLAEGAPVSAVTLPPFTLAPGARALIVKNVQAFTRRYGAAAAARIAGTWPGDSSLDNGGEVVIVLDHASEMITGFAYGDSGDWPERADGDGSALEYTALTSDPEDPASWRASDAVHGQPGITQVPAKLEVVVNEILANTALPQHDMIELRNNGAAPVNLSGWYLSSTAGAESAADYKSFRIPDGTSLAAGAYLSYDASVFSSAGQLPLDGNRGGKLWLVSAEPATGKLQNFEQEVEFTPVAPGVAYGASPDGSGSFMPLAAVTAGAANAGPRVGPVQLSEIHYFPASNTPEYVEITNTGSSAENLGLWTLRGDVDFDFPASLPIAAGESVVMVSFNPTAQPAEASAFRSQYGVGPAVQLVGPWVAGDSLGNAEGTVRLRRLVPPPAEEPGYIGLMIEDEVNYSASAPWPTTAAGTGSAIRRIGTSFQGSDPAAWAASAPSPGSTASGYDLWKLTYFPGGGGDPEDDADGDGMPNLVEYKTGTHPGTFSPLETAIDPNDGSPRFVLTYTLRTDRTDASLGVFQSSALDGWVPAAHDELISTEGNLETRRAWLPLGEAGGFLRLQAE